MTLLTHAHLLDRYGPLLTEAQLGEVLHLAPGIGESAQAKAARLRGFFIPACTFACTVCCFPRWIAAEMGEAAPRPGSYGKRLHAPHYPACAEPASPSAGKG